MSEITLTRRQAVALWHELARAVNMETDFSRLEAVVATCSGAGKLVVEYKMSTVTISRH